MSTIPKSWYKHITTGKRKKADLLAILILHDLMSNFKGKALRRTYLYYANTLGVSKYQVKQSIDNLVKLKLIKREFKNIEAEDGLLLPNTMYLEPLIQNIEKISK